MNALATLSTGTDGDGPYSFNFTSSFLSFTGIAGANATLPISFDLASFAAALCLSLAAALSLSLAASTSRALLISTILIPLNIAWSGYIVINSQHK